MNKEIKVKEEIEENIKTDYRNGDFEQSIINNHIAQFKTIEGSFKKGYQARCRKCGELIKLDAGEEGLCPRCI